MKKHIKIISLLSLFVITSATFFIFAKRPADDKPETVMVRSNDEYGELSICYGADKIEELSFKARDQKSGNKLIIQTIQKLNSEGYKVISQSQSGTHSTFGAQETWVLTLK